MKENIEYLESKIAHLEHTVSQLNEIVIEQQNKLEIVTRSCKELSRKIEILDSNQGDSPASEPPPHY